MTDIRTPRDAGPLAFPASIRFSTAGCCQRVSTSCKARPAPARPSWPTRRASTMPPTGGQRGLHHLAGGVAFPDVRASPANGLLRRSAIPESVYYVGGFSTLEADGLGALVTLIRGTRSGSSARPGWSSTAWSPRRRRPARDREFKKFLHEIQMLAELTHCIVLLLTNAERASGFFPEHTMVDGVLHLTDELSELRPLRHIRVLKMRGSARFAGFTRCGSATAASKFGRESRHWPVRNRSSTRRRWCTARSSASASSELDEMLRGGVRPRLDHHAARVVRQRQDAARHAVPRRRA